MANVNMEMFDRVADIIDQDERVSSFIQSHKDDPKLNANSEEYDEDYESQYYEDFAALRQAVLKELFWDDAPKKETVN